MSLDRYYELLNEADALNASSTKTAILEEAVREAEVAGDEEAAYDARCKIIESANLSGEVEKGINAFSWCLAKYDAQEPYTRQGRAEFKLLWRYKWILGNVVFFPSIARAQIISMQDDMQRRYAAAGYGLRTVYDHTWTNAMWMGDQDTMREYFERWQREPRDGMTDCEACEVQSLVLYYSENGQYKMALRKAKPLRNGQLHCRSVPAITNACLLIPTLLLKKWDEAAEMHKRGYRSVRRNPGHVWQHAEHLQYLVLLGDLKNALALVKRHLAWAVATSEDFERCLFYVGCQLACELGDQQSMKRSLRLPKTPEFASLGEQMNLAELAVWSRERVDEIVARFDARNDNNSFSQRIAKLRELVYDRHATRA